MFQRVVLPLLLLCASPALADGDELSPVPAPVLIGHAYFGDTAPSQIRFVNVRTRPVKIDWITFQGGEQNYAMLAPGEELIQPTFVAHRWLIKDGIDGQPLEAFISTRSAARDNGAAQIALIR
ncbi:MAG TPA: hypothetical protein VGE68_03120 [Sphingomicrobium sp.]